MNIPDIHKFKWVEMCNDSTGRTSTGKFISLVGGLASILTFCIASAAVLFVSFGASKESDAHAANLAQNIALQSVALFTLCIGHLTTRRFSQDKKLDDSTENGNFGITDGL